MFPGDNGYTKINLVSYIFSDCKHRPRELTDYRTIAIVSESPEEVMKELVLHYNVVLFKGRDLYEGQLHQRAGLDITGFPDNIYGAGGSLDGLFGHPELEKTRRDPALSSIEEHGLYNKLIDMVSTGFFRDMEVRKNSYEQPISLVSGPAQYSDYKASAKKIN